MALKLNKIKMVFDRIIFKHTNIGADEKLHSYVTSRLSALQKYIAEGETDVKCEVEFEKVSAQQSGRVCRIEVNVWVAGTLYRAEATEETFEAATDVVRDEVDAEMNKAHKKRNSLIRRGGRKLKEMMRFGK